MLTLCLALPAHAAPPTRALVVRDQVWWWSDGCPNPTGGATEQELEDQGVPYDSVSPAAFASADLDDYTMIILPNCQGDATYEAWNARVGEIEDWVRRGGFLAAHLSRSICGSGSVIPQVPGGAPAHIHLGGQATANVLDPTHPITLGMPPVATGNSFTYDGYTSTGLDTDVPLILATSGEIVLTHRPLGLGHISFGHLTYEFYQYTCGGGAASHTSAGDVMHNEIAWGKTFPLCGDADSDGDGVGDLCDICDGGDDTVDTDGDGVPDDCDPCPNLPWPDDLDGDGICDDIDDSDGDGIVDLHDVCPEVYDPEQTDTDGDGYGDACDACPNNPMAGPKIIEWFVDLDGDGQGVPGESVFSCTRPLGYADNTWDCDDSNRHRRLGAPEVCDGIDNDCDGVVDYEGCDVDALYPAPVAPPQQGGNAAGTCNAAPAGAAGWLLLLGAGLLTRRRE